MKSLIRFSLVSAVSLSLFACGGARIAHNREAAAAAAFNASRGADTSQSANPVRIAMEMATSSTVAATANCPHGGKVSLSIDATTIDASGNFSYAVTYDNCNYDGHTSLHGSVTMGITIDSTATTASLALTLKGRVDFSGDISDYVQMDVTETVDATALNGGGAQATVVLNGTISTSSDTYTYDHETVVISTEIPADDGTT